MDWGIFLGISAAALAAAVFGSVCLALRKRAAGRILTPFNTLLAGVLAAVYIALLPPVRESLQDAAPGVLQLLLLTLHQTMQAFTIDVDAGSLLENVRCAGETTAWIYSAYLSVLFVLAPALTFGFLLSILRNVSAYGKYLAHYFAEVYAFSGPNVKSVTLAADLKKNHPRAQIVFANCGKDGSEWQEQAKELGAVCFSGDLLSIGVARHAAKAPMTFFAVSEDEPENISLALRVLEAFRNRENTSLYVLAGGTEGDLVLSGAEKGKVRVRRVDEERSLIYHGLYNRGEELFRHARGQEGEALRQVSVMILGLGRHGSEMLRALSWYGQMDGYRLTVDAFDLDPAAEDRFRAQCPELLDPAFNGAENPDDARYTIRIHSGVDVTTQTFLDEAGKLGETTWALVALGSDESNLRAAAMLRQQFERMQQKPVIQAILYSTERKNALAQVKNFRGESYDIEWIGDLKTSWSEEVMMNSCLEREALQGHLAWGDEDSFWNYEYNYCSSMAAAIHRKAREACGIPGADKPEDELTPEEREGIGSLEHRRWNAYMRSEGYIFSGSTDKKTRNDLGKMHHDLVGWSRLTDEQERRKDSRVGSKKA
jgi:hypothetical protein